MTASDEAEYISTLPDAETVLRLVAKYAANPDVWVMNRWVLDQMARAALERIELTANQ